MNTIARGVWRPRHWAVQWLVGFVALAAAIGAMSTFRPTYLIILALPIVGVGLMSSAHLRLGFIVFGGLVALFSSADLTPIKIGYLVGVVISLFGALRGLHAVASRGWAPQRLLLGSSLASVGLFGLSALVALWHGTALDSWVRDVAPFVLFASVPIVAIDASDAISRRLLIVLFFVAAVGASAALVVELLSRREIIASTRVLGLPSGLLPIAAGCYALSLAFQRKRWLLWASFGIAMLAELVLTGTRAGFVVLFVPLIVIALSHPASTPRIIRTLQIGGLSVILVVGLQSAMTQGGLDTAQLTARITTPLQFQLDRSLLDRQEETRIALATWLGDPLFGTGPGHSYVWARSTSGEVIESINIDTGLSLLSKFGLFGLLIMTVVGTGYWRAVGASLSVPVSRSIAISLVAYSAVAVGLLVAQDPIEDKGFSFGLIFLLALLLRAHKERYMVRPDIASHGSVPEDVQRRARFPPPHLTEKGH